MVSLGLAVLEAYAEAEQNYRKAVGVYPDMADAWNNLAEALIKLDKKSEARAETKNEGPNPPHVKKKKDADDSFVDLTFSDSDCA